MEGVEARNEVPHRTLHRAAPASENGQPPTPTAPRLRNPYADTEVTARGAQRSFQARRNEPGGKIAKGWEDMT